MTNEDREKVRDEAVKFIDAHVSQLAEHFENVQIFCSRTVEGGEYTLGIHRGAGNVYAREGQAREWLVEQDETVRQEKGKLTRGE
jgi:hypothetical protein